MLEVNPPEERMFDVEEALGFLEIFKVFFRTADEDTSARQRKSLSRGMAEIQFTLEGELEAAHGERRGQEDRRDGEERRGGSRREADSRWRPRDQDDPQRDPDKVN